MRKLTLCADDFGLSRSVDEGILSLVNAGRLNAVSCMSVGKCFEQDAKRLMESPHVIAGKVEVGLHVTLTEYEPLGDMPRFAPGGVFSSVFSVLIKTHIGLLNRREVRLEIERQWQRFVDVTGREPDFVDGHQHAHLYPFIRKMVVDLAKARFSENQWIRLCDGGPWRFQTLKDPVIIAMAKLMRLEVALAKRRGNPVFLGINRFDREEDFGALMRSWLSHAKHRDQWAVIMCHPGHPADGEQVHDPISERRADEFSYLSSDAFAEHLEAFGFSNQLPIGPSETPGGGGQSSGTKKSGVSATDPSTR